MSTARDERLWEMLAEAVSCPATGWSLGSFGAIAEFHRDAGEAVRLHHDDGALLALTSRGGLRIERQPGVRAVAYETPARARDAWSSAVAFCLPSDRAAMNRRRAIVELGPDRAALREEDREAPLFDLGLGAEQVDICVRPRDAEAAARLRAAAGRGLLDPDCGLMTELPALSPHRVFIGRFARLEVYQSIPPPKGSTPDGPHTHVLPNLLAHCRTHAATTPIPSGFTPLLYLHAPNALRGGGSQATHFDREVHDAFQVMLRDWGEESYLCKSRVFEALKAGVSPEDLFIPNGRHTRAAVRVALRQAQFVLGACPTLSAWRALFDVP
jgi:hypothetical protein